MAVPNEGNIRGVFVEAEEDAQVLHYLLKKHGVITDISLLKDRSATPRAAHIGPRFETFGGSGNVLKALSTRRSAVNGTFAVVLDRDPKNPNEPSSWDLIVRILDELGVKPRVTGDGNWRAEPDPAGFIGRSEDYRINVGVWLMPDNSGVGALEHLLLPLVPDDELWRYAKVATNESLKPGNGGRFKPKDHDKANIRAWLAWHEKPGAPYGHAVADGYVTHDSPAVRAFVTWFKRLFQIP